MQRGHIAMSIIDHVVWVMNSVLSWVVIALFMLLVFLLSCRKALAYNEKKVLETIIYEAGGESLEGQTLVASCIENRARERELAPVEVVTEPWQFSCWNKGAVHWRYTDDEMGIAKKAWDNRDKYTELGINMYCRYDCEPYWADAKGMHFVCRLGNHKFYREERP